MILKNRQVKELLNFFEYSFSTIMIVTNAPWIKSWFEFKLTYFAKCIFDNKSACSHSREKAASHGYK